MRALPMGNDENHVIYTSFTLSHELFKRIEPAGEAFEVYMNKKLKPFNNIFEDLDNAEDLIIEEDTVEYEWEKEYKSKVRDGGFKLGSKKADNYYILLGLEDLFINATIDDVRRSYKKLALLYHPDKNKSNENDTDIDGVININITKEDEEKRKKEINDKWLGIKDAYETLIDPERRKKYDSTFDFDDEIPEDTVKIKSEKHFFEVFGPVFLNNSIWSKRKPIPKIGDMNTPLNKVKKFYQFWYNFDTWRDFSMDGEYNLDDASCRYEKRQMMKENKKMKATMFKEERTRLYKLVENSYKNDPRILFEQDRINKEKEKLRIERLEKLNREKKEEEERIIKLKIEYEERKRKEIEERAKLKEDLINELVNLGNKLIKLTNDDIFLIKLNGNIENLQEIFKAIDGEQNEVYKVKLFKQFTKKHLGLKYSDVTVESTIWTKDELFLLQKAVKKFPAGTKSRWDKIMEVVKSKPKTQIIHLTHYLSINPFIKIEGDTIDLNVLLKNTQKELEKKEKITEPEKNEIVKEENANNSVNTEDVWTEDQQKNLEAALKKFPGSLPANERWTKISGEVPGKNKKQCVERFKFISQLIKNKKV